MLLDGVAGDVVAEVVKRPANSRGSPGRAASRHLDDKLCDRLLHPGASRAALGRAIILGGDELPVPSKQRVGRHDGAELLEGVAADGLGLLGKTTALLVGPADAAWAELLAQSAAVGLEVVDHRLLVTIDPAGEHVDKKLKVEVHPQGDERGSGGKFQGSGEAALHHADAA